MSSLDEGEVCVQSLKLQHPHERMKGCAAASFITVHALPVAAWEKSVTARTADDWSTILMLDMKPPKPY